MIKYIYKFKFVFFSLLYISFFSCRYTKEDAERYLPGRYSYEIPTGELQELKINPDFTFKQIVYSKNKKNILYENNGKMYVEGENIKFDNWLECYEPVDQKMLLTPYNVYLTGIFWKKPKENENLLIIIFDQDDYIFKKENGGNRGNVSD